MLNGFNLPVTISPLRTLEVLLQFVSRLVVKFRYSA